MEVGRGDLTLIGAAAPAAWANPRKTLKTSELKTNDINIEYCLEV
jgi:hypothetical protein